MSQYVIAGLVIGGIYAISSAGLVATYLSTGILNFAFGSLAFFVARFYYYLHTQEGWPVAAAGAVSILLVGPALGVFLYFVLFRYLRLSSPLVKVVATLGLSVTIPPLATLMFGNQTILKATGLAPQPVRVFHVDGVPVTMDQIIVYVFVLLVVVLGALLLRYTDIGLRVRAMVDSPAMTSLSGTDPAKVSLGVWAVSIFLAGLSGVLSAPIIGLDPSDYTLLMASAFAAVIAARLRSLPVAVIVGFLMGIAGALVEHYLPPSSSLTADVIPSIPFVVTAIFLLFHILRRGRVSETDGIGGALDRAISVQNSDPAPSERTGAAARTSATTASAIAAGTVAATTAAGTTGAGTTGAGGRTGAAARMSARGGPGLISARHGPGLISAAPPAAGVLIVALLPLLLHGFWVGLVASGVCYGIILLSYTLVIGEGGMVWLCMVTFAGAGGLTTAQLATTHHWPVLAAVVAGGIVAMVMGIVLGVLTVRLGDLYVALVTLTFGLLMENLVFSQNIFNQYGIGVNLALPSFAGSQAAFTYVALAVFVIVSVFIVNLRRSTTGMALAAVRATPPASATIGVGVLQMKVVVAALASFVAGIGGALLAVDLNVALPADFATLGGVVWLAVLVSQGIRSNIAALVAGLSFTLLPGIALAYLPTSFGQVPPILFGLGAIFIAKNPDGAVVMQARQLQAAARRLRQRTALSPELAAIGGAALLGDDRLGDDRRVSS